MSLTVSVVYLTKNGGELFASSLEAVLMQEYEGEVEVVAVDSGSTDGTLELLERTAVCLFQVQPQDFNFGLTRDYGFSLAKGEIVVPISQDAIPVGTDWLARLVKPFADPRVAVVQGCDTPDVNTELFYWERLRLFYYTRDVKKWMKAYNNVGLSFTACAIRRSVWEKHPLGRVEMSEDKVFQRSIVTAGYKIHQAMDVLDYHSHMYNLQSLAKRCENEGLGWRSVGIGYSLGDMLLDMANPLIWCALGYGVLTFNVKRLAEVLFPLVRPFYLYKGNKSTSCYVH